MDYTNKMPLVITSEDEAWSALERALDDSDTFSGRSAVRFEGWPVFTAYAPPKRLDSALTPYMMEGYIDLQRAIFRTYAFLNSRQASARLLSDLEKDVLELVVRVDEGSSKSSIDFTEIALRLVDGVANKMEPKHVIVIILGSVLLFSGGSVLKTYLDGKKDEKIATIQSEQIVQSLKTIQFSEEKDVERMAILERAKKAVPALGPIEDESNSAKQSVIKHYTKTQDASLNGVKIGQEVGQRLTRDSRADAVDVRLDGIYKILQVDTTSPDGFRVRLENIQTGEQFYAGVQDALMSLRQKSILQDAEWKKVPVTAQINAKRRRGEIVEAVVIDVSEYDGD